MNVLSGITSSIYEIRSQTIYNYTVIAHYNDNLCGTKKA